MKRHTLHGATGVALQFRRKWRLPERWFSWLIFVTDETSSTTRGAAGVIVQLHQTLRLARKMALMINPRHTWNVHYNALSNRSRRPKSPNIAPTTKNDDHDWSLSRMKHHWHCAEQQEAPFNVTKYCACHEKRHSKIWEKFSENRWNVIYSARPIPAWSDHGPRKIRPWTHQSATSPTTIRLLFAVTARMLHSKIQPFALRLSFQISSNIIAPAKKSDVPT